MSQYESRANRYMRTLIAQIMKIKTCFFFTLMYNKNIFYNFRIGCIVCKKLILISFIALYFNNKYILMIC